MAYTSLPPAQWKPFAQLVLDAAYEATLWAAVLNAQRSASNIVLLTRLGAGAFGNDDTWIDAAMRRALMTVRDFSLDVHLVSYGALPPTMLALIIRRLNLGGVHGRCASRDFGDMQLLLPFLLIGPIHTC